MAASRTFISRNLGIPALPARMFALLALLLFPLLSSVHAQEILERQVPIDAEGRLEELTEEQEREAHFFPDVKNFVLARLFEREDSTFVMEVESRVDGKVVRTRRTMTAADAAEFRTRVTNHIHRTAPQLALNQEGRSLFLSGTTTLGLLYYGWSVPMAIHARSGSAAGLYFLLAGTSWLYPHFLTKGSNVTNAMARLSLHGGAKGIYDGFLVSWLLAGDIDDLESQAFAATGTLMSIGELIAGYNIARVNNLSTGQASVLSTMGTFGAGLGLTAYGLTEIDGKSPVGPLMSLGGSAIGYIIGNAMSRDGSYSGGDATVLSTAGILGAGVPVALLVAAESEDEHAYYIGILAGSVAGLWAGDALVHNREFSESQGNFVGLATVGGGLMGLGFGLLVDHESPTGPFIGIAVGATAGFAMMYSSVSELAKISPSTGKLDISLSPLGLAAFSPAMRNSRIPLPLVQVSMRF